MRCPSCGKGIAETSVICSLCGSPLSPGEFASPETPPQARTEVLPSRPKKRWPTSVKALKSLILGLLTFVFVAGALLFAVFVDRQTPG